VAHEHTHVEPIGHVHGHDQPHGHPHQGGVIGVVRSFFVRHTHDASDSIDQAMESNHEGIRTVKISLAILGGTAVLQAAVVALSGSVALLGDTLHNLSDALTALPLWLAFSLGTRRPTNRFTYGYGRSEDLAGIVVVLLIAISAALVAWQSIERFLHPQHVSHIALVMVAAVIGFVGNETVAHYRLRVGRHIGSAALVADGLHARADGATSLAVLVGAIAVAAGLGWADPVVGLIVSVLILVVLVRAVRSVGERLMDAVDPALVEQVEGVVRSVSGVVEVGEVRIRWVGHRLNAEVRIVVRRDLTVVEAHDVAEASYHAMLHQIPKLSDAIVHTDPTTSSGSDPHASTAHHRVP
jgi:cation diffusion facilitator family transporter